MSINIAEWNGHEQNVRIEISNNAEFIARVKEINRELHVRRPTKVRVLGDDRIPAEIQRLIDKTEDDPDEHMQEQLDKMRGAGPLNSALADEVERQHEAKQPETSREDLDKLGAAIKDLEAVQAEHGVEVPKNPPPPPKPTEKPKRRVAMRARPGGDIKR